MEVETYFHEGFKISSDGETESTRIVWFADEDKTTKRELATVNYVYYTSDNLPPRDDGTNILEGNQAIMAFRQERCAKD